MSKGNIMLFLGLLTMVTAKPFTMEEGKGQGLPGRRLPKSFAEGGTLIVGGVEAKPNEFPWIVAMRYAGVFSCAGTIITPELVLTAAHCVKSGQPGSYQIVAGEHDREVISGREQIRGVERILLHESYGKPTRLENDIALMKVSPPFDFNEYVGAVNLPVADSEAPANATVSGWGRLEGGRQMSSVLKKVDVPHVDHTFCKNFYSSLGTVTDNMVCYGRSGNKSACHGDSGGPVVGGLNNNTLIGIVSWGSSLCARGWPNVYTWVASFVDAWVLPRITPQSEDPVPLLNVTSCGTLVEASSGLVSLENLTRTCIVTFSMTVDSVRFRLLQSSLGEGDVIIATRIEDLEPTQNFQISEIGKNYNIQGGIVLVTIKLNPNVTTPRRLQLDFYYSGYNWLKPLTKLHSVDTFSTPGTFSYPIGAGNYDNNENTVIILLGAHEINFTRMDLEPYYPYCYFDSVTVLRLQDKQYVNATRTCATTVPRPISLPDGVAVLHFVSDDEVTKTGFTFSYN